MQVEDHAGYKAQDVFTRWLPQYDSLSYQEKVTVCRRAIDFWAVQLEKSVRSGMKVTTDIAKKKHGIRADWCQANLNRWRNSLRECMIDAGVLFGDRVPFE